MNKINLGNSGLIVSEISVGCMRMSDLSVSDAAKVIDTSVKNGIDFFDHADIYGGGKSEEIFASAVKELNINREDIFLQSKCGIRQGFFDFSKEHIIHAVEGSLKRLGTDYLDALLLHRPDTLVEPEEVAEAFNELHKSGKVRQFGVSNQHTMQVQLLQKYIDQKLIVNQLQFGIMHTGMIDSGINVNMKNAGSVDHDGGILEFSRLHDMTIQAWSPYQYGFFEGVFLDNDKFPELNQVINRIADEKNVTNTTIATSWILRHPAKMQTIVGTMNPSRINEVAKASGVVLSREEWYEIYRAAGNILP